MIAELGHFAVIIAFVLAIAQSSAPLIGAQKGWIDWMRIGSPLALLQFAALAFAFGALTYSFIVSDFSVRVVASNSNSMIPLLYKITGVWGNHEGSMLLWVLTLALFGAMVAGFGGNLPSGLKARTLAIQGMIGAAFLGFILFTSNPFWRMFPAPADGADLNPLLQDPGLAFHPPFLYFGYVGLSMSYSFAIAALIEGRVDAAWARWVRPWTLLAWISLTLGIALGSWWAYYELGWGGWWFWDPVENASFMPWLIATALLHSAIVVEKRATLKSWTILLSIFAFSLSLIGTFIVRSGVITSVHAFASDPTRGVFILGMLIVAIGGGLALYAWRAPKMRADGVFAPVSRESGLILNNLLLTVACAVVFVGTLAPLFREMIDGAKISVGAPFFNMSFTPFMILLGIALPFGAIMPWKRGRLGRAWRKLMLGGAIAFLLCALIWTLQTGRSPIAPIGLALAAWIVLGVVIELAERVKAGRAPLEESLRKLVNVPRADWGKFLAHTGFGFTIFGIAAVTAWQVEDIRLAAPGDVIELGGYEIAFDGVSASQGPNYQADIGRFIVSRDGREVTRVFPEKRFYPVQRTPTTEAGINSGFWRDIYVVLGDPSDGGAKWAVRSYVKPYINWIWLGALVMAFGGLVSLTDRRYRVGAVAAKRRAARLAAQSLSPAE
ncbi:heme lyase CcmF/NrfE family subunit [Pikeienuella sp. HZG-20]|uniref:heme lyase CcmF/NrfE family subunit n=1 Tax=Paludibacillus litoralis TaxID=3133267 RepID=UPI0030EB413F